MDVNAHMLVPAFPFPLANPLILPLLVLFDAFQVNRLPVALRL